MKRHTSSPTTNETTQGSNLTSTTRRLLLHTEDGVVPYLTPSLLNKCFPAKSNPRLWLGIEARTTCILPAGFRDTDQAKPKGYTFSNQARLDPWIQNYPCVTVPSFDLQKDAIQRKSPRILSSNKHIMMWTPHGRNPITPQLYYEASKALQSSCTIPLFDCVQKNLHEMQQQQEQQQQKEASIKHKEVALGRTTSWLEDYIQRKKTDEHKTAHIWAPILMDALSTITIGDKTLDHMATISELANEGSIHGIICADWHYQRDANQRKHDIHAIKKRLPDVRDVGVLCTDSLAQFLDALESGCNIIGSDLPLRWAKEHKIPILELRKQAKDSVSAVKRARTEKSEYLASPSPTDEDGCVDLSAQDTVSDHPWFRDKSPIQPSCPCFTCKTHSKAYLYHLVCAKELYAEILIFIHALQWILDLLELIDEADFEANPTNVIQSLRSTLLSNVP